MYGVPVGSKKIPQGGDRRHSQDVVKPSFANPHRVNASPPNARDHQTLRIPQHFILHQAEGFRRDLWLIYKTNHGPFATRAESRKCRLQRRELPCLVVGVRDEFNWKRMQNLCDFFGTVTEHQYSGS